MSKRDSLTAGVKVQRARPAKMSAGRKAQDSAAASGPGVTPEQRRRMAECCAFFKAEHYREASPAEIRQRDIEAAELEIAEAVRKAGETNGGARPRK